MQSRGTRLFRRVVLVLAVVLVAPIVPMPGFATEVVAAVERAPVESLRPADRSEVADLEAAVESAHEAAEAQPVQGDPDHGEGDLHDHEAIDPGQRLLGGSEAPAEFRMIGVALDSTPEEPVLVRVREDDRSWGPWRELHLDPDEGPDLGSEEAGSGSVASEPVWVDRADAYEVSVAAEDAEGAEVITVREQERTVVVDTARAGASAPALQGMHFRSEWGARAPKDTPTIASTVKLAVVHHSVSSNSYSQAQVPSVIRGIQAYHMDGRGWDDIGYNFVVDRYGGIWEGRGGGATEPVVGAHASGFNTGTVGVMLLGDFSSAQPTSASVQSAGRVIGWKLALHDAEPSGSVSFVSGGGPRYPAGTTVNLPRVVGHQQVGSTACPGNVMSKLGSIRASASAVYPFVRALLSPEGAIESVVGGDGTISVSGWAVDRSSDGPASVRTSAGPVRRTIATTLSRPDIQARFGGDGRAGFSGTLSGVPPGMQPLCATVWSSLGHDRDKRLGCTWTLVGDPTGQSPVGRFQVAAAGPGRIDVSGWALDPQTSVPVTTDLLVDGVVRATVTADGFTDAVPAQYRSLGRYRSFRAAAVAVPAGSHTVCMRARNQAGGVDTLVDCRILQSPGHDPGGVLESVSSNRPRKIDITGWALDLETTKPIDVLLVVDGRWHLLRADRRRDDVAADYPGYGAAHGFAASVTADGGPASVCAYGISSGGGENSLIGCRRVQVVK